MAVDGASVAFAEASALYDSEWARTLAEERPSLMSNGEIEAASAKGVSGDATSEENEEDCRPVDGELPEQERPLDGSLGVIVDRAGLRSAGQHVCEIGAPSTTRRHAGDDNDGEEACLPPEPSAIVASADIGDRGALSEHAKGEGVVFGKEAALAASC